MSKTIFSVPQVDLQMVRRQFSEDDMNRAGTLIGQLDNALKIALQEQDALGKIMQECGAANAALGQELRRVFTELGKGNKVTPQQLKAIRDKNEFQQLNRKLQQSVDEANKFRAELRAIKDEVGIREDARERAQKENVALRRRLETGLDARAAGYLERISGELESNTTLADLIKGLDEISEESINNKRPDEEISNAFEALKVAAKSDEVAGLTDKAPFVSVKQPPEFVNLYKALVTKILDIEEIKQLAIQARASQRELAKIRGTIDADIEALARSGKRSGESLGGGSLVKRRAYRRNIAKTRRNRRRCKPSRTTRKGTGKTRKSKRR